MSNSDYDRESEDVRSSSHASETSSEEVFVNDPPISVFLFTHDRATMVHFPMMVLKKMTSSCARGHSWARWKLGFNEKSFVVDLKKGEVKEGTYEDGKPDATFSFTDDDFIKVANGKMNPQIAFMRGAMKIKGSISAAQKFTPDIFPKPSKM
ncbi:hypothetical protein OROGR_016477 [Orobanche gracilis]